MMRVRWGLVGLGVIGAAALAGCLDAGEPALVVEAFVVPSGPLSFDEHVLPILEDHGCPGCHVEGGGGSGNLDATSVAGLLTGGDSGPVVVPCDPEGSYMYRRVRDGEMPLVGRRLVAAEVDTIAKWIAQGAQAEFAAGTCPNPPLD